VFLLEKSNKVRGVSLRELVLVLEPLPLQQGKQLPLSRRPLVQTLRLPLKVVHPDFKLKMLLDPLKLQRRQHNN
jgi:hypothetical protein